MLIDGEREHDIETYRYADKYAETDIRAKIEQIQRQ